ncbi:hypothetical protein JTE90_002942 [Oedothorax gibbosus]|uniref:Uncharacterized protein n=1 Tax=Oedothorax gibbosus TaxID=931172 RepID=A0AAV6UJ39_9ARAC|nr:hypothetical protein JTE90_002942 [Oedothorax gibbosus]
MVTNGTKLNRRLDCGRPPNRKCIGRFHELARLSKALQFFIRLHSGLPPVEGQTQITTRYVKTRNAFKDRQTRFQDHLGKTNTLCWIQSDQRCTMCQSNNSNIRHVNP